MRLSTHVDLRAHAAVVAERVDGEDRAVERDHVGPAVRMDLYTRLSTSPVTVPRATAGVVVTSPWVTVYSMVFSPTDHV